jgi:hypothetical protein
MVKSSLVRAIFGQCSWVTRSPVGSFTISLLHSEHKQGIVAEDVKATGALMPCRRRQFLVAAIAPATTKFKR